jgi:NTE family protein
MIARSVAPNAVTPLNREPLRVDFALQGGGAHGAYTWGVLDRLLQEPWLQIEGVSGTSAGAMNAAVLVSGHAAGGAEGAREALETFWRRVAQAGAYGPMRRGPIDFLLGRWTLDSNPVYMALDLVSRMFSPYDMNPSGLNPLHKLLDESVDFDRLGGSPIKLFVTATNVRTGRLRIFRNKDVTADALLASACLPFMFQAVEFDGEAYWDGGYAGNPPITPLVRECESNDTILVPINPIERPSIPRSAREIIDRVNEVSFNASLLKELRMIAMLRRVVNPGHEEGARWAGMRMHMIPSETVARLGVSSKSNTEWEFFCFLRGEGRRRADEFLAAHADDLGQRSTVEIEKLLSD